MLRALAAFVAAVMVAYALAALAQTQHVMSRLVDMGVDVGIGDRIRTALHDFVGMSPLYLPMIAIGFAIAFAVARGVLRVAPRWRPLGYPLAGGAAVLAIHVILNQLFDVTAIAAARTTLGLTVQALCGAAGGWLFGYLSRPRRT